MKAFFEGIQDLFENHLFLPFDFFRSMDGWWSSNVINGIFIIIGFVAMAYWLKELKGFNDRGEENKDITAQSFL